MNTMRSSLVCELSPNQTYRTKKKASKQIQRTHVEQYVKISISYYCAEIKRTNSSSTMIVKTKMVHDKVVFERIYNIYIPMHARNGFYLSVR